MNRKVVTNTLITLVLYISGSSNVQCKCVLVRTFAMTKPRRQRVLADLGWFSLGEYWREYLASQLLWPRTASSVQASAYTFPCWTKHIGDSRRVLFLPSRKAVASCSLMLLCYTACNSKVSHFSSNASGKERGIGRGFLATLIQLLK